MSALIKKIMEKYNTEKIVECDDKSKNELTEYFKQFQDINYDILELEKIESENYKQEKSYHYIACLSGGNNGNGKWNDYLCKLAMIFDPIHWKNITNIEDMWLIQLDNDCLDDVHTAYIGIKIKE